MNLSALATVGARVIEQFSNGARARLRSRSSTRQTDGSSSAAWADVANLTNAPVLFEDLGAERALKLWGATEVVHAQATVALPVSTSLSPIGLGLAMIAGPRAGMRYLVVGVKADDTSRGATLALQTTRDTLGVP